MDGLMANLLLTFNAMKNPKEMPKNVSQSSVVWVHESPENRTPTGFAENVFQSVER